MPVQQKQTKAIRRRYSLNGVSVKNGLDHYPGEPGCKRGASLAAVDDIQLSDCVVIQGHRGLGLAKGLEVNQV